VDLTLADQEKAIQKENMEEFVEADRRLHVIFGEVVHNERMAAVLENVRDLIHVMGKGALVLGTRPEEVVEEHRRIVEAIRLADPAGARQAMAEHIENTRNGVLQYFREHLTQS
jgi:DNA-binding FadR family transcriptional regulator